MKDTGTEKLTQVSLNLACQVRPVVVHSEQDALNLQRLIERLLDSLDGIHELGDAFQSEELALDRHEDRIGSDQGIERQQIERWGAIDQDEVIIRSNWLNGRSELQLAVLFVDEVEISSHEVPIGGGDGEPFECRWYDHLYKFRISDQHIVESLPICRLFDPEARRGVPLRVGVN